MGVAYKWVSSRKSQKVAYKWGVAYSEGLLVNGGFTVYLPSAPFRGRDVPLSSHTPFCEWVSKLSLAYSTYILHAPVKSPDVLC